MATATHAASYLCSLAGYTLWNLKVQRLLFIAHMRSLGVHNQPLIIGEPFYADTRFGPIIKSLYKRLEMFGAKPVKEWAFWCKEELTQQEKEILESTFTAFDKTDAELIALLYTEDGSWALNFGRQISNTEILKDYNLRIAKKTNPEKYDPMRALESLTPGGSEYYNNIGACLTYIKSKMK